MPGGITVSMSRNLFLPPVLCLLLGFHLPGRTQNYSYELLEKEEPRPLRVHVVGFDWADPNNQLAVAMAPDPDGKGAADTKLVSPGRLAKEHGLAVAVNANAWANVALEKDEPPPKHYREGGLARVLGWVVSGGNMRSHPQSSVWHFWVDKKGTPRFGNHVPEEPPVLAVAGFGGLLKNGKVLPKKEGPLHPRSALGWDSVRKRFYFVVVDGRQRGVSEGVSEKELAELLQGLGCTDGINLDGGGSSILLADGRMINRPSGFPLVRPVPVLLGLKKLSNQGE